MAHKIELSPKKWSRNTTIWVPKFLLKKPTDKLKLDWSFLTFFPNYWIPYLFGKTIKFDQYSPVVLFVCQENRMRKYRTEDCQCRNCPTQGTVSGQLKYFCGDILAWQHTEGEGEGAGGDRWQPAGQITWCEVSPILSCTPGCSLDSLDSHLGQTSHMPVIGSLHIHIQHTWAFQYQDA